MQIPAIRARDGRASGRLTVADKAFDEPDDTIDGSEDHKVLSELHQDGQDAKGSID